MLILSHEPKRARKKNVLKKVPPRFELGLLDSESNVLTTRPWDLVAMFYWLLAILRYISYMDGPNSPSACDAFLDKTPLQNFAFMSK